MKRPLAAAVVTALVAVIAAATGARPVAAMEIGLGDQNTGFFSDPRFQELPIDRVRIVVPWDTALTDDPRAAGWIDLALARGLQPLVAFENSRDVPCPGPDCHGPSGRDFKAGLVAFHQRWPQITELTPWNEPNHRSQPTAADPGLAAQYYNAARRACGMCVLVAGDVLDGGDLRNWIATYRAGLVEEPVVWGLHNYYDATYFSSTGLDTLTRLTTGQIWLTETGGIVRFAPAEGGGLPYDEQRAADSIRWLYSLTAQRPRVTRMYLYHWQGLSDNRFDGGLVGPQGQPRPGLAVVREHVGRRPAAGDGAGTADAGGPTSRPDARSIAAGDPPIVFRLSNKALRIVKRGVRIGAACVSAPRRCTGRISIALPTMPPSRARLRLRTNFDLRPGTSLARDLRVSPRVRRRLLRQRRLAVTYCLGGTRGCHTVQRRVVVRASR